MTGLLSGFFWFVFVVSALFLMLIILIQEGKGGGLAEAFGGQGAETFGVKATGVNRVTGALAAAFIISSILLNKMSDTGVRLLPDAVAEDGGGAGPTITLPPSDDSEK